MVEFWRFLFMFGMSGNFVCKSEIYNYKWLEMWYSNFGLIKELGRFYF